MPSIDTRFGTLEYLDEARVHFPWGIPGFEDEQWFVLVDQPVSRPLVFLQSLENPNLSFMTLPVVDIAPDYRLRVLPEDLERLELASHRQPEPWEVLSLVILCAAEDDTPCEPAGPLVINRSTRSVQAIEMMSRIRRAIPWCRRRRHAHNPAVAASRCSSATMEIEVLNISHSQVKLGTAPGPIPVLAGSSHPGSQPQPPGRY
jgi:flagellar assembly factor FliW